MNDAQRKVRVATVEEHLRAEDAQDLEAIMATFSDRPDISLSYNFIAIAGHEKIRRGYFKKVGALPKFTFPIVRRHICEDTIIEEHKLLFEGRDGKPVEVASVVIYDFDEHGKLLSESVFLNELPLMAYFYPDKYVLNTGT